MSRIAAAAKPDPPGWRHHFIDMLPAIKTHAQAAFEHLGPEDRPDAVQEAIGRACLAMARLAHLGKTRIASPAALARYSVAQVNRSRKRN